MVHILEGTFFWAVDLLRSLDQLSSLIVGLWYIAAQFDPAILAHEMTVCARYVMGFRAGMPTSFAAPSPH